VSLLRKSSSSSSSYSYSGISTADDEYEFDDEDDSGLGEHCRPRWLRVKANLGDGNRKDV